MKRLLIMKKAILISLAWALALSAGCSAPRAVVSSDADRAVASQVDQMLTKRMYKIDCTRAYPQSAPSFQLNDPYFISVIDDRVESFLPYFGRAYTVPYGGGEGLRFAAPVTDYSDEMKRNGRRVIEFTAITDEDRYEFTLTVFPKGDANLTIGSFHKQSISFSGRVDMAPEFEAVRVE